MVMIKVYDNYYDRSDIYNDVIIVEIRVETDTRASRQEISPDSCFFVPFIRDFQILVAGYHCLTLVRYLDSHRNRRCGFVVDKQEVETDVEFFLVLLFLKSCQVDRLVVSIYCKEFFSLPVSASNPVGR